MARSIQRRTRMSGAPANLGRGNLMAGLGPQPVRNLGRGNLMLGLGAPINPGTVRYPGTAGLPGPGAGSGGAGAGGGGGAGSAAPDAGAVLPVDPIYDAAVLAAQRARDTGVAALTAGRQGGLSNYGFTEAAGGALAFDPNNPFSKAALLKQTYDRQRRSSAQSMGSSGGLYSGAFQNQQDFVNRGQLGAEDAITKALQGFLAQNTRDVEKTTGADYAAALSAAEQGRIARAPTNPLYQPSASEDDVTPVELAPAPPGTPPRKPKAKKGGGVQNLGRGNLMTKLR